VKARIPGKTISKRRMMEKKRFFRPVVATILNMD
jgi:hypothetical protein